MGALDMLVRWKDQTESWIKFRDMKESHSVEMVEFAKLKGIDDEPAFAWWTPIHPMENGCDLVINQSSCPKNNSHAWF